MKRAGSLSPLSSDTQVAEKPFPCSESHSAIKVVFPYPDDAEINVIFPVLPLLTQSNKVGRETTPWRKVGLRSFVVISGNSMRTKLKDNIGQ